VRSIRCSIRRELLASYRRHLLGNFSRPDAPIGGRRLSPRGRKRVEKGGRGARHLSVAFRSRPILSVFVKEAYNYAIPSVQAPHPSPPPSTLHHVSGTLKARKKRVTESRSYLLQSSISQRSAEYFITTKRGGVGRFVRTARG